MTFNLFTSLFLILDCSDKEDEDTVDETCRVFGNYLMILSLFKFLFVNLKRIDIKDEYYTSDNHTMFIYSSAL